MSQKFKLLKYNDDTRDVPAFYFPHHDDQGWPLANKMVTFIIYFSDVIKGGETVFCSVPVKGLENTSAFEPLGVGKWDSRQLRASEMEERTQRVCTEPASVVHPPRVDIATDCIVAASSWLLLVVRVRGVGFVVIRPYTCEFDHHTEQTTAAVNAAEEKLLLAVLLLACLSAWFSSRCHQTTHSSYCGLSARHTVVLLHLAGVVSRFDTVSFVVSFLNRYLKVKPRKGSAVVFWSYHPNGVVDLRSFHGGCPVLEGTKWMGQQWILGTRFEESEWKGDNFRQSVYNPEWFQQSANKDVKAHTQT